MERELDQVSRKRDHLAEKLDNTAEVDVIVFDDEEYNASNSLRKLRTTLLNKRQELMRDERIKEKSREESQ